MKLKACALGAALLCAAPLSHADIFHYRNLLVGDRAIGLGGAYVALSGDTSGLYYNPAGAPYSPQEASASVNALNLSSVEYEGFFPDGSSLKQDSSGLMPGYFGLLRQRDFGTVGFSIAVTDSLSLRQYDQATYPSGVATINEYITSDVDYQRYLFGPSYAAKIGGGWSWGLTLYGTYSDLRESRTIGGTGTRAGDEDGYTEELTVLTSYRIEDTQLGLRPLLGLQYRSDTFSLGVTLAHEFGLSRNYDYFYRSSRNQVLIEDDTGTITPVAVLNPSSESSSDKTQDAPWQISAGLAWQLNPKWMLSTQLDWFTKVDQAIVAGADADSPPVTRQFKSVLNWAVAAEYHYTPDVAFRLGVFSDDANVNVNDAGPFEARQDIDLLGVSAACQFRLFDRQFQIGSYYRFGNGRGTLGDLGELDFSGSPIVDARASDVVVFFGTTL